MSSGMKLFTLPFLYFFIMPLHRIEIESSDLPNPNEDTGQYWTDILDVNENFAPYWPDIPDLNENPAYQWTEMETYDYNVGSSSRITDFPDPNANPGQFNKQTENIGSSSRITDFPDPNANPGQLNKQTENVGSSSRITDFPDPNANPGQLNKQTENVGSSSRITDFPDPNANPGQLNKQTENAGSSSKLSPFPDLDDGTQMLYETNFKKECIDCPYAPKYFVWQEIHDVDTAKTELLRKLCVRLWGPKKVEGQTPFCEIDNCVRGSNTKFRVKFFKTKNTRDRKGDFLKCKCEMYLNVGGTKINETKTQFFTTKFNETHYFTLTNLGGSKLKITGLIPDPLYVQKN